MGNAILVAHPSDSVLWSVGEVLEGVGYRVVPHRSARHALDALAVEPFGLVVVGAGPTVEGRPLWRAVLEDRPDLPLIILSERMAPEHMLAARRCGVVDFVRDPRNAREVVDAVGLALSRPHFQPIERLPSRHRQDRYREIIGKSPAMRRVRDRLRRFGHDESPLVVEGETGTGKGLVATVVREHGPRAEGPFVAINCAAIPAGLIESELFGHEKGAFTGAVATKFGLFKAAHRGTVFLDEVDSLPLAVQPKLLKVLEDKTVRPLGGGRETRFDARLICATSRSLHEEARAGRFRSDLLYRIDVLRVTLPPLRKRNDDVLQLAEVFLRRSADRIGKELRGIAPAAAEVLRAYSWPGNVRELQHVVEAAVAMTTGTEIAHEDLPREITRSSSQFPTENAELATLREIKRRHGERTLRAVGGNKAEAARILGISRNSLYRLLRS